MSYIMKLERKLEDLAAQIKMCPCDFDAMDEYDSIQAELNELKG